MRARPLPPSKMVLGISTSALLLTLSLPGCGGGSGGSHSDNDIQGTAIHVTGTPGRLSQTPEEANAGNGTAPPPSFPTTVTTENQWFRLEFPFNLQPKSFLDPSTNFDPFSNLNGNITIVDANGAHVPCLVLVNGVDAFGVDHKNDVGFPHDLTTTSVDRNLGKNVLLFVADADGSLATLAPFGGYVPDPGNPNAVLEDPVAQIDTVRVNVFSVNGLSVEAAWSFTIGTADARQPFVVSVASEERSPTDPLNPNSTSTTGSLVVRFSEPMVPHSVGRSAELDGAPFTGNMPNKFLGFNAPPAAIVATVNVNVGTIFVPFDCAPINVNNLTTYRFRPLISLPSNSSIDVLIRSLTGSSVAPIDLTGNSYDGQDGDGDGIGDGADHPTTFAVGPGAAIVNIPVSPQVVYFVPSAGNGLGAIDLDGWGYSTNTPGANSTNRQLAPIVTAVWLDLSGCEVNPGGLNGVNGQGHVAHPGNLPPGTNPCTALPNILFPCNAYIYPVGLGSYPYGPVENAARATYPDFWEAVPSTGNPGTAVPGINEGSSGFETLCRNSDGEALLTGGDNGTIGNVQDLIVGDFLDRVYFDKFNPRNTPGAHISFFGGGAGTLGRNLISDPPIPNPPPMRYWIGLPQTDVVFDQNAPGTPGIVIEGEEVWTGHRPLGPIAFSGFLASGSGANYHTGYVRLQPDKLNPVLNADKTIPPHQVGPVNKMCFANGPGHQSMTATYSFASRQQIGNFLYVTDASTREVHAVNSNTMRIISSISLPDPTGLGMAPDLKYLYVTNFSDNTLSVIGSDPGSPNFHREVARVPTGIGPRAIAVQEDNEDIFVCNHLGNTVSIIDPISYKTRKTLDSLILGPWDVEAAPRQQQPGAPHPFGWQCGVYFAYISNLAGNSVVVYESGPDGPRGIGIDNIRGTLPIDDSGIDLISPRGLCMAPFANPSGFFASGCFVAHRDNDGNGRVSHIQFTQQAIFGPLVIQVPPGFFIPPGFTDRVFEIVGTWGNTSNARLAGHFPSDVALSDMNTANYLNVTASGAPNFGGVGETINPERSGIVNSKAIMRSGAQTASVCVVPDRLYVAFDDTDVIQVLSPVTPGLIEKSIERHGGLGTKKLGTYWRQ